MASGFTVVRARRVWQADRFVPADVVIDGNASGKILSVEEFGAVRDAERVIEVPDECVVLPAATDSHVHVNEPGNTDWEGFTTATQTAIRAGVTAIADMPLNSLPVTTTVAALRVKQEHALAQCYSDLHFIGGVIPGNTAELAPMVEAGVCGFKCFLIHSGLEEFPHVSREQVREALIALKEAPNTKFGQRPFLMFHAEVDGCCHSSGSDEDHDHDHDEHDQGKKDDHKKPEAYETFLESRPKEMENEAIKMVIDLCRETGVPCHIVHLSSAEALPLIAKARAEGVPLTVETCFHYLSFEAEAIPDGESRFKCCPPIREAANRAALWKGLLDGTIDMVVSDHSPCTANLKTDDFMASWGGISGLQYGIASLNTFAPVYDDTLVDEEARFARIVEWMCLRTAQLIGLGSEKGVIAPGFDGDLMVFNAKVPYVPSKAEMCFKNKVSAFEKAPLTGEVQMTLLRGQVVFDNSQDRETFAASKPRGKMMMMTMTK